MIRVSGRRFFAPGVTMAIVGAVLASCTSARPLPEPVEVETCEGLEDVGVQLVEVWVEVADSLPYDELVAEPPPPEMAELARIGSDLDARAARLGCDVPQLNAAIRERVLEESDIDPQTAVGGLLLEIVTEGMVSRPPPPAADTTTTGAP